jgi:hypothetical protein
VVLATVLGCFAPEGAEEARGQVEQGLTDGPDFIVTSVKGPASTRPGQSFTAQVTVCNQGTIGDYTEVGLFLSEDATIRGPSPTSPPEDAQVGNVYTPYLSPGQCTTLPVSGNAYPPSSNSPTPVEAWYLGAMVDPYGWRPELLEDNNTNAGYRMGVGYRADFIVTAVKGPTSVQPGQFFTAQVTVCNQGTNDSSTEVGLFLSADATIRGPASTSPPEDAQVGNTYTPYLAPGQCVTLPVSGNANPPPSNSPTPVEAWYLGAMMDPYGSRLELIEDNNTHTGHRMGVGYKADFIVTSVKGPASMQPGQPFTAQVTVCNQGNNGDSTEVGLFLSEDATLRPPSPTNPPEDAQVGNVYTPYLTPGQCVMLPVSGNAYPPPSNSPTPVEAWYLGAMADPYSSRPELIEDNNTHAGYRMGVGYRADFIVTSVKGPTSVQPGQPFAAQVTVCNQGTIGDATEVGLFLSADATLRGPTPTSPPEDMQVGNTYTPYLSPGQCATVPVHGNAYPPPYSTLEAFYLGAMVDPYGSRLELLEDNNTNAGYRMGVGNKADFIVTSVTGPASAQSGQTILVQVTVCNQGTQSGGKDVAVYLSEDTTLRPPSPTSPPEDAQVGNAPTGELPPGQCATLNISGPANLPPPGGEGAWYLGAMVDPYNGYSELIEDNNTKADTRIGIGNKADFVVTAVTGVGSVKPGNSFVAKVTVCNRGQLTDSALVDVFLSSDTTLQANQPYQPSEDIFLGSVGTTLAAGQCATRSMGASTPTWVPEGAYYLGAIADVANQRPELIEDNNAGAGNRIGVGYKADFVVTAVTGPTSIRQGVSFTANVTLCNQGQFGDTVDAEVLLSADTHVRLPAPPHPPEDFYLGSVSAVGLGPGQCLTRSLMVTAPSVPEGGYYLSAVVDPYNQRPELIEDNNATAGNRIGLGYKADFVVTVVTGPSSVKLGSSFLATFTVCNHGQQGDSVDVDLYLSMDTTLRKTPSTQPAEDFFVGSVKGIGLGPGACVNPSIGVYANVPVAGPYYLGAIVDPLESRPEIIEDNNTKAGTLISVTP